MDIPSIKDIHDQEVLEHCVEKKNTMTQKDMEIAARRAREGIIRPSILDAVNKLAETHEKKRSKKEPK